MPNIKHVAIIMDGNGRWAKALNKPRTYGHLKGTDNVRNIAIACNDYNVEVLTVYAFSTENWKRPKDEINYLMSIPKIFFDKFMREIMEKNIKIQLMGEPDHIPVKTLEIFNKAIKQSANNTGMVLNFAMNYGSQKEIVLGIKKYTEEVLNGTRANDLTATDFNQYLMTKDFPPVDLLIRTSGEQRLSNFLLYQLAYTELIFVNKAWPEFTPADLYQCFEDYQKRDRRYGGLKK